MLIFLGKANCEIPLNVRSWRKFMRFFSQYLEPPSVLRKSFVRLVKVRIQ